jgi:putative (di)nucleoside polyphosphate hydrolase
MRDTAHLPYRPNVGVALFARDGRVLIGQSMSAGPEIVLPGLDWQMPQGGVEPGEDIAEAAARELFEETNVRSATLLAMTDDAWRYDFPPYDGPPHKLDRFRGQEQRWAAFRFIGEEAEIDVVNPGGAERPEFLAWRWERLDALPDLVVPFKRDVYRKVAAAFARFTTG